MKLIVKYFLLVAFLFSIAAPVWADQFSYSGSLASDDQVLTFAFDVTTPGSVTLQTFSYAGGTDLAGITIAPGGFDPVLTLFDVAGNFLITNDDGPCGVVGTDPSTYNCFDAYINTQLDAGLYTVALTEADNLPLGNLSDGFSQVGNGDFSCPEFLSSDGAFCDASPSQRGSAYDLGIETPGSVTPEPATWLLLATGVLLLLSLQQRTRFAKATLSVALAMVASTGLTAAAQTLPVSGDTFISAGSAANYSTSPTVNVGGAGDYQGLISFDLSGLPAGTTSASVSKATITLFVNKLGSPGAINVYAANGPWAESTVSGTNAPSPGTVVASQLPISTASTYLTIDATALVKSWLDGTTSNSGILIVADPASPSTSVLFDSKESSSTSHPAVLQVVLTGMQGPRPSRAPPVPLVPKAPPVRRESPAPPVPKDPQASPQPRSTSAPPSATPWRSVLAPSSIRNLWPVSALPRQPPAPRSSTAEAPAASRRTTATVDSSCCSPSPRRARTLVCFRASTLRTPT